MSLFSLTHHSPRLESPFFSLIKLGGPNRKPFLKENSDVKNFGNNALKQGRSYHTQPKGYVQCIHLPTSQASDWSKPFCCRAGNLPSRPPPNHAPASCFHVVSPQLVIQLWVSGRHTWEAHSLGEIGMGDSQLPHGMVCLGDCTREAVFCAQQSTLGAPLL